jgi:GT2 family glycosyltransferase
MSHADSRLRLAAVVVQYGHADETRRTLTAMLASSPPVARLIVVDNASPDGAAEAIAPFCAEHGVELVRAPVNRGYAAGANVGVRLALSDPTIEWIAYCNNDVELEPTYFARVIDALQSRGGACGSGVLLTRDGVTLDYGGGHVTPWRALVVQERDEPGRAAPPRRTQFVTACAMVVHRSALATVGLLPEAYAPGYLEDAEFSWRLDAAGLTQWVVPTARGIHAVSASFGGIAIRPATLQLVTRNRLWFARRNFGWRDRSAAWLYFAVTKPARVIVELLRGRPAVALALWRGWLAGAFATLPAD